MPRQLDIVPAPMRSEGGKNILDILGDAFKVFVKEPAQEIDRVMEGVLSEGRQPNPIEALSLAMYGMGGVGRGGFGSGPRLRAKPKGKMTLYHGSPHTFDEFSMDKVGTGEGYQAFGHGLYFTESKSVAKDYAEKLSDKTARAIDKGEHIFDPISPTKINEGEWWIHGRTKSAIGEESDWFFDDVTGDVGKFKTKGEAEAKIKEINRNLDERFKKSRNLYKVDIGEDKDNWLDWYGKIPKEKESAINARMKKQRFGDTDETVFDVIGPAGYQGAEGKDFYRDLAANLGNEEASNILRRSGLKGVRYPTGSLSGGRRTSKKHNYVLFDDKDINIKEHLKYGAAFTALIKMMETMSNNKEEQGY